MKKVITAALGAGAIFLGALTSPLMAGSIGVGLTGHGVLFEADGTEHMQGTGRTVTKNNYSEAGAIPSGYVQYTFGEDGFVIGLEKIPGALDLGTHTQKTRTDWVTGNTTAGDTIVQTVKAELSNHKGFYLESPALGWGGSGGLFVRSGVSQVTLKTMENLGSGGAYGNGTSIEGISGAIGFRGTLENGMHLKFMVEQTNYENVKIVSTDQANGATHIDVNMDTYAARISVGINF